MNPSNREKTVQMLATGSATAVSTANVDCDEANYATIIVGISSGLTTDAVAPTISLLESDDTVATNFATVTADNTLAIASAMATQVYKVDLKGRKRYLRVSVTPGTVATDDAVTVHAFAQLADLTVGPASTTDMVGTTNDQVTVV